MAVDYMNDEEAREGYKNRSSLRTNLLVKRARRCDYNRHVMNADLKDSQSIDSYDIFQLMGLSKMTQGRKDTMLVDMNSLIWNDFLGERLSLILTSGQLHDLKEKIDSGADLKEILDDISGLAPNFPDLLAEYTRSKKVELIRKHYQSTIEDLERMFNQVSDEDEKMSLREKREKYVHAVELLRGEEWEKIVKLLE